MIQQFINYIINNRGYSQDTARAYEYDLRTFAAWARKNLDSARWSTITKQDIEKHIESETRSGKSASTTNRRLASIAALYRYMQGQGLTIQNPCQYESRRKIERTIPNTININQLRTCYEKTAGVVHVMLGLLIYSGIRISELRKIEWHDIDTENNTIRVKGKGAKQRIIAVPAKCLQEIAYAKRHCNENGIMFDYSDRSIRWMIHDALKEHCQAPQLSPHAIRHTFATNLAANGVNVTTIASVLGHEHIETTQKYINMAAAQNTQATITHAI